MKRRIDAVGGRLGQVEAEVLDALVPGPVAFLLGRGQVQRQRVTRSRRLERDQRPGPEDLGHAERLCVKRRGMLSRRPG
jgi:hypothetical protein